jgi:hypothetical protein
MVVFIRRLTCEGNKRGGIRCQMIQISLGVWICHLATEIQPRVPQLEKSVEEFIKARRRLHVEACIVHRGVAGCLRSCRGDGCMIRPRHSLWNNCFSIRVVLDRAPVVEIVPEG